MILNFIETVAKISLIGKCFKDFLKKTKLKIFENIFKKSFKLVSMKYHSNQLFQSFNNQNGTLLNCEILKLLDFQIWRCSRKSPNLAKFSTKKKENFTKFGDSHNISLIYSNFLPQKPKKFHL